MGSIDWAPNWVSPTVVSTVPQPPLHPRSLMCVRRSRSRSSAGPEPGPGSPARSPALAEPSLSGAVPSSESAFHSPMRGAGLGGCAGTRRLNQTRLSFFLQQDQVSNPGSVQQFQGPSLVSQAPADPLSLGRGLHSQGQLAHGHKKAAPLQAQHWVLTIFLKLLTQWEKKKASFFVF